MKLLGIDYGEMRTGLALGNSNEKIAIDFGVLANESVSSLIKRSQKS